MDSAKEICHEINRLLFLLLDYCVNDRQKFIVNSVRAIIIKLEKKLK